MDLLPALPDPEDVDNIPGVVSPNLSDKWELKELKPRHRQVAALASQGKRNTEIATIVGITPEYVSMLLRQPLVKQYVSALCDIADTQIEALYPKVVETIADVLECGSEKGRLQAARLQLEATRRIGRPDPAGRPGEVSAEERLEQLANRLKALQTGVRQGKTFNENGQEIEDV